jgi:predicted naringenin-chalcone synthase
MTLDRQVPDVLARHVGPAVDELLARNGLGRGDVQAWAVHPGGPRILDVVADRLGLAESDLAGSRRVLAEHGNCSSATLLLVLDELRRRPLDPGAPVVAMAFGPGLTLYACLLRWTEAGRRT